jgi:hypothetical protein
MWISRATIGGLVAAAGFSALALTPAQASDLYIGTGPAPVYEPAPVYAEPAPVYEAYPEGGYASGGYVVAPAPRVIVQPAPRHVIVHEAEPYRRDIYVRDVPVPPPRSAAIMTTAMTTTPMATTAARSRARPPRAASSRSATPATDASLNRA